MSGWLGVWELIPDLSICSEGGAPQRATYTIAEDGDNLRFTIKWTDAGGKNFEVTFAAPPDGTSVESPAPDVDTFSVLAEDAQTLSGNAIFKGREVGLAMRRVSDDGQLLSVMQKRDFEDGPQDVSFQVYRRVSP